MCVNVCQFRAYNPAEGGPLVLDESSDNGNGFYSKERVVSPQETVRCRMSLHFFSGHWSYFR